MEVDFTQESLSGLSDCLKLSVLPPYIPRMMIVERGPMISHQQTLFNSSRGTPIRPSSKWLYTTSFLAAGPWINACLLDTMKISPIILGTLLVSSSEAWTIRLRGKDKHGKLMLNPLRHTQTMTVGTSRKRARLSGQGKNDSVDPS
jgi:hypothetical protein